jgi:thiol-disulfide isomerase/thioredoxin
MRLPALMLVAVTVQAQTSESPCRPSREVETGLESWNDAAADHLPYAERRVRRERLLEPLLKKHPGDLTVQQRYVELHRGAWNGTGIPMLLDHYQRKVKAEPGEPAWIAMHARLLIGRKTPEAIDTLEKLSGSLPQARVWLADIYSRYPNYRDQEKAWQHLREYWKACPESLEGFSIVARLNHQVALETSAVRLRKQLEQAPELRQWSTLWSMEFKARPAAGHEAVRKQVRADLERIEALKLTGNVDWYDALQDGYELVGDKAAARRVAHQFREKYPASNAALRGTEREWGEANPYPKTDASPGEKAAFARKLLEASGEWMRRWPHSPMVWHRRFQALAELPDPGTRELEAAADGLLEALRVHPDSFLSFPPAPYQIAEAFLKHNCCLERIPALFAAGTAELEESRAAAKASDFEPPSVDESRKLGNYALLYWRGYPFLIESHLKTGNMREAGRALAAMEDWLMKHKPVTDSVDAAKAHSAREDLLRKKRARLAEVEGNIDTAADDRGATASKEGEAWTRLTLAMPEFEITDTAGRIWRLGDLKGKRTVVNVWSTWCGPCKWELPVIQKLHDRLKGRDGVQVISMSVDENPGLVQPFMLEKGFTFPALPAKGLVDGLVPLLSIPRTWIVSTEGVITHEKTGFAHSSEFEQRMIGEVMEALEGVR